MTRSRTWAAIAGVVGVLAMAVGINLFADSRLARTQADLTENQIYTLSPGTEKILGSLKQPITLRLFYSRALGTAVGAYGTYADHVREMLEAYAARSKGQIRLEIYNPEPFSSTEDRALAYGLQGVPLDRGGEKVYFGLAGTNQLDDQRIIAFFQPDRERFLEYDLSKLVFELSNPARPVVGIMSSLPVDGNPQLMMMALRQGMSGSSLGQPYASATLLRQTNTVKPVPLDTQVIPPDIKVLLVADARNLSDATQYAIDQFVMRSGRLMVMVDPWSDSLASTPSAAGEPPTDTGSDLHRLFAAWGIEYDPTKVVGSLDGAWRVRASTGGTTDYVAWFTISRGINHDDPATADLHQVSVATPGFIAKAPGSSVEFTPLLTTEAQTGTIPIDDVKMPDPAKILAGFKPEGGPRVIAARVRGTLHSAFEGPPALPNGQERPKDFPPHLASTKEPANLVVVADSDILADRFWITQQDFFGQREAVPFSDNGPFVANLIDTLAGSDALLGLRARGTTVRPFTLVDQMQAEAEAKFRKTEQALQAHLDELQKKLASLRTGAGGTGGTDSTVAAVITPAQRAAIQTANQDIIDTRAKLRAVQFELNRDISRLKNELIVFNIVLVPALLTLAAIIMGIVRRYRRTRPPGEDHVPVQAASHAGARA
jgi:ABC-type uncharacterized transport system involved in gliding motility auxiliary subunit